MSYQVRLLARARHDLDDILSYISERSPEGAARLLAGLEKTLTMLEKNPFLSPLAPETEELQEQLRHIMFRTRAGRTYRALFVVVGDEVRVLRVRGSGQPPVTSNEIGL
ncbi:MAG: type II toxin-antitoxin system RelE/ParE family toxin [Isosphaeraceae bacterium]